MRLHLFPDRAGFCPWLVNGEFHTKEMSIWVQAAMGGRYGPVCPGCEHIAAERWPLSPEWARMWNGWTPEPLEGRGAIARWAL